MRRPILSLTAILFIMSGAAAAPGAALVVDGHTAIVLAPDAPEPIRRAVDDLRDDFAKVFGTKPRLVTQVESAGSVALVVGEASTLPADLRPTGAGTPESFSIAAHRLKNGTRAIVLSGPDKRGTIYAVYQFSLEYLGVDPMYYWTDKAPARRRSIAVPASLAHDYPSPLFRYRGFFINDEDLLTGWAPGETKDKTGIALAVWDKIFETILRLKGNMVVPGTWIFPDDPQNKLVGERGLILTQHHAIPLGVNVARWPAGVPYNYSEHPEILERAWTDAVAAYDPHQEILWSVGLRGLSDTSYDTMDPSVVGNDPHLGELISKAIAKQMAIVRAVRPDAQFVTDFWQEGTRLMQKGLLSIPPGVIPVWADSGYGVLHDQGKVAVGQGAYYHVAMLNGRANQLSEMVPVDRIQSELGRYIAAGATQYFLLNTSDIRPVAMTAKAAMDVAWGGVHGGAAGTYREWAAREFGTKSADAVARVYDAYFKAFPHLPADARGAGEEYGDQLYHSEARQLLLSTMVEPPYYQLAAQSPRWTVPRVLGLGLTPGFYAEIPPDYVDKTSAREIDVCGAAQTRWDAVWNAALAAEALVAPERRNYYAAQMLTMIAVNRDSNRILYLVSRSVRDAKAGRTAQARAEATETLKAFDEIRRYETGAEYGKWKHWYRGEWLDAIDQTRDMVENFIRWLDDPMTRLPPPVQANAWQAYYRIMHYEGARTVDVR